LVTIGGPKSLQCVVKSSPTSVPCSGLLIRSRAETSLGCQVRTSFPFHLHSCTTIYRRHGTNPRKRKGEGGGRPALHTNLGAGLVLKVRNLKSDSSWKIHVALFMWSKSAPEPGYNLPPVRYLCMGIQVPIGSAEVTGSINTDRVPINVVRRLPFPAFCPGRRSLSCPKN
jgi:hypothetical protein